MRFFLMFFTILAKAEIDCDVFKDISHNGLRCDLSGELLEIAQGIPRNKRVLNKRLPPISKIRTKIKTHKISSVLQMYFYATAKKYNYCITVDGKLNIGVAGNRRQDKNHKHYTLCNQADENIYSGQILLEEREEGGILVTINARSGTYSPDKENLPMVKNLFIKAFSSDNPDSFFIKK